MINKITVKLKATLEKNGKYIEGKGNPYILETSYCFDGKGSPEYKPTKKEAEKLIKMCISAAESIKEIYN